MRPFLPLFLLGAIALGTRADDASRDPAAQPARAAFEKKLAEAPDSAATHLAYGDFLGDRGELRAAVAQLRLAQMLEPGNAAIANSLGGLYLRMGRAPQSAAQFRRAIESASEVAAYHYNLANVEFLLRRDLAAAWQVGTLDLLHQALAEYREASRLSPDDMEYARSYAETFYGLPDPDWSEAEAAWKHVLALAPQSDFAFLQLARISLKRGEKAQARMFLDQIKDARHDSLKQKLRAQADGL